MKRQNTICICKRFTDFQLSLSCSAESNRIQKGKGIFLFLIISTTFDKGEIFLNALALFCITLKSIIYGSSVFFTGQLTETTDVFDILAIRFLITAVVMFILKKTNVLKMEVDVKSLVKERKNACVKYLLLSALFEPVLYMIFETLGISMTTGVTAGVILALAPIIACVLEVFMLKEKGTFLKYLLIVLGMLGVLYITVKTDTTTGENRVLGIIFMFLAVFSGVVFSVFVRKSSKHFKPIEISYVAAVFGALVFNTINIVRHLLNGSILTYFAPLFNYQNLIGFAFLSIMSSIVATALGNYSLKKMQVSTNSAFSGLSMLVTIAVGVILNNEHLYYYHYIGISLILIRIFGIIFLEKYDTKKVKY